MDPADFISLAIRLSNNPREADLRTAVSRAYYGAFHLARRLLRDCGVQFSGKDLYKVEIHRKLRYPHWLHFVKRCARMHATFCSFRSTANDRLPAITLLAF